MLQSSKVKTEDLAEKTPRKASSSAKRKAAVISDDDSELESPPKKKPATSKASKAEPSKTKPRKSHVISSDDDEEDDPPPKKTAKKPTKKPSRKDDDFVVSDGSDVDEKPAKKATKKAEKSDKPGPKKKAAEDADPLVDPPKPKFKYALFFLMTPVLIHFQLCGESCEVSGWSVSTGVEGGPGGPTELSRWTRVRVHWRADLARSRGSSRPREALWRVSSTSEFIHTRSSSTSQSCHSSTVIQDLLRYSGK